MKIVALSVLGAGLALTGNAAAYLPLVHHEAAATLTADAFGQALAGTANQFAGPERITNVHCVQPDPGDYMCSYAVVRRGRAECHLMQGSWSPDTLQIEVTLAGRTKRCATLRDAIRSLQ